MSEDGPRLTMNVESLFSRIVQKRQEKRLSKLQEISEEIDQLIANNAQNDNANSSKTFTERELLYYLYLNPTGKYDVDIMKSPIAQSYFEVGILTKGVSDGMESQYRLTSLGRDQIKNALTLEMLS